MALPDDFRLADDGTGFLQLSGTVSLENIGDWFRVIECAKGIIALHAKPDLTRKMIADDIGFAKGPSTGTRS